MKKAIFLFALCMAILGIYGCAGVPLKLANQADEMKYDILGESEGSCIGIMLFQLIPINQNFRFQCAYNEAVSSKGGDALINVEIQENWFWAYILNGYRTTVKGTVIKFRK